MIFSCSTKLFVLVVFILFPSSFESQFPAVTNIPLQDQSVPNEQEPLFKRSAAVQAEISYSHLSALIAALYTIPSLQRKFFEESIVEIRKPGAQITDIFKNSFTVLTAINFARMRLLNEPFSMTLEYIEIFKKVYPKFDSLPQNSIILADSYFFGMLKALNGNISNMFQFNVLIRRFLLNHPQKGSDQVDSRHCKEIVLETFSTDMQSYIQSGFLPMSQLTQSITKDDRNFIIQKRYEITSKPEILAFQVKRFTLNADGDTLFNPNTLIIHETIKLPMIEERFVLVSRVVFDWVSKKYSTYARDFGNLKWYQYTCDGVCIPSKMDLIDMNSVLLFYVPESSIIKEPVVVPAVFSRIINMMALAHKRKSDEIDAPLQLTPEEVEKWKQLYLPDVKQLTGKYLEKYNSVVIDVTQRMKSWPMDVLNCFSKLVFKTYRLGSEVYSFKMQETAIAFTALEFILSSLAASQDVVIKLFKLSISQNPPELDLELAAVVAQMLLGCKLISLERIDAILKKKIYTEKDYKSADLCLQIRMIINLIDNSIIGCPTVTSISYADLLSDDPVLIMAKQIFFPVKASDMAPFKSAVIRGGVYFDCKETATRRRRDIYKSESDIFIVEIYRKMGEKFDNSELIFDSDDYTCFGVISNSAIPNCLSSFFQTDFNPSKYLSIGIVSGHAVTNEFFDSTSGNAHIYNDFVRKRSSILFFKRKPKSDLASEMPLTSEIIPLQLSLNIFRVYWEERKRLNK